MLSEKTLLASISRPLVLDNLQAIDIASAVSGVRFVLSPTGDDSPHVVLGQGRFGPIPVSGRFPGDEGEERMRKLARSLFDLAGAGHVRPRRPVPSRLPAFDDGPVQDLIAGVNARIRSLAMKTLSVSSFIRLDCHLREAFGETSGVELSAGLPDHPPGFIIRPPCGGPIVIWARGAMSLVPAVSPLTARDADPDFVALLPEVFRTLSGLGNDAETAVSETLSTLNIVEGYDSLLSQEGP